MLSPGRWSFVSFVVGLSMSKYELLESHKSVLTAEKWQLHSLDNQISHKKTCGRSYHGYTVKFALIVFQVTQFFVQLLFCGQKLFFLFLCSSSVGIGFRKESPIACWLRFVSQLTCWPRESLNVSPQPFLVFLNLFDIIERLFAFVVLFFIFLFCFFPVLPQDTLYTWKGSWLLPPWGCWWWGCLKHLSTPHLVTY